MSTVPQRERQSFQQHQQWQQQQQITHGVLLQDRHQTKYFRKINSPNAHTTPRRKKITCQGSHREKPAEPGFSPDIRLQSPWWELVHFTAFNWHTAWNVLQAWRRDTMVNSWPHPILKKENDFHIVGNTPRPNTCTHPLTLPPTPVISTILFCKKRWSWPKKVFPKPLH